MKSISLTTIALSLFTSQVLASCGHGTSLLKRQIISKRGLDGLTSRAVRIATFEYLGAIGPVNWHNLSPANTLCANGTLQSPIDLVFSTTMIQGSELNVTIPTVNSADFENLGSTVEVVMGGGKGGELEVGGKAYELLQFHFHTPGEHTVDGEHFPLEMYMVHQAAHGALAVLGSPLHTFVQNAPVTIASTGSLDFTSLIATFKSKPIYTYKGSLTTPPCTEGPQFYISSAVFETDVQTYNALKGVMGFNSRFVQNEGGAVNVLSL